MYDSPESAEQTNALDQSSAPDQPAGPYVTAEWGSTSSPLIVVATLHDPDGSEVLTDRLNATEFNARRLFGRNALKVPGVPSEIASMTAEQIGALVLDAFKVLQSTPPAPPPPQEAPPPAPKTAIEKSAAALADTDAALVESAERLLRDPDMLRTIGRHLEIMAAGERELKMLCYLYGVSRLLSKPLNIIITGPSSSGKTYTRDRVVSLFPPEAVYTMTDATQNAFYYLEKTELMHRIVCSGERLKDATDANADKTRALREMVSTGVLRKTLPQKDASGVMRTVTIECYGPIAFSESTTSQDIEPEDANRCIVFGTDESEGQTVRCMTASDDEDENEGVSDRVAGMRGLHFTVQRLLEQRDVVIPFARAIRESILPAVAHNLEMRRIYPLFKGVIKAAALLFQLQRERTESGKIIATIDDYAVARDIAGRWLAESALGAAGLSADGARHFFEQLLVKVGVNSSFTAKQAANMGLGGLTTIRRHWLPQLEAMGAVVQVPAPGDTAAGNSRGRPSRWFQLVTAEVPDEIAGVLPPPEAIAEAWATMTADDGPGEPGDGPGEAADDPYRADRDAPPAFVPVGGWMIESGDDDDAPF